MSMTGFVIWKAKPSSCMVGNLKVAHKRASELAEVGYEAATMKAIAERAGASIGFLGA
jgi:hypothetical protein